MGSFMAKQILLQQGFNYKARDEYGFPTKAGGSRVMIAWPKDLRQLPQKCPRCHKSSGLQWIEMKDNLLATRREFINHAEAIFAQRLAKGDSDPYRGFKRGVFVPYPPKANSVVPEKAKGDSKDCECEDENMGFPVDVIGLAYCNCMKHEKPTGTGYQFYGKLGGYNRSWDYGEIREIIRQRRLRELKVYLPGGSGSGDKQAYFDDNWDLGFPMMAPKKAKKVVD